MKQFPIGPVSSGTLQDDDLLDAFADTLESLAPLTRAERKLLREARAAIARAKGEHS